MLSDTIIPEAFDAGDTFAGLVTIIGFLFALTKPGH
jgi:hypothetical protein